MPVEKYDSANISLSRFPSYSSSLRSRAPSPPPAYTHDDTIDDKAAATPFLQTLQPVRDALVIPKGEKLSPSLRGGIFPGANTPNDVREMLSGYAERTEKAAAVLSAKRRTDSRYTFQDHLPLTLLRSLSGMMKFLLREKPDDKEVVLTMHEGSVLVGMALASNAESELCVDFLVSNPMSVAKLQGRPAAAGRPILALCEQLSADAGHDGALRLEPTPTSREWYRGLGFVQHKERGASLSLPPRKERTGLAAKKQFAWCLREDSVPWKSNA